jgi:hypothetical protein
MDPPVAIETGFPARLFSLEAKWRNLTTTGYRFDVKLAKKTVTHFLQKILEYSDATPGLMFREA